METTADKILRKINGDVCEYINELISNGVFKTNTIVAPTPLASRIITIEIYNSSNKKRKTIKSLLFNKFHNYIVEIEFSAVSWNNDDILHIYFKSGQDLLFRERKEKLKYILND